MLEECGVPYDTVLLEYGTTMKAPDYLAINPMGQGASTAARAGGGHRGGGHLRLLGRPVPRQIAGAYPGNTSPRGLLSLVVLCAGPLESAATAKALNLLAPAERAAMQGYGSYADVMNTLEQAVSQGPYLCGDHFTAVDLYAGAHLIWGMQFGTIERRPAFERYAQPFMQRPAFVRASQIDDALVQQSKGHG